MFRAVKYCTNLLPNSAKSWLMYEMFTVLNCSCAGWVVVAPQKENTKVLLAMQRQRSPCCHFETQKKKMSFGSALISILKPPQFITTTKTIDLESQVPWIFCFSAYEEVEKFLKVLRVIWAHVLLVGSAGVPTACWKVVGVTEKAYFTLV